MGADVFAARPDLLGHRAEKILGWSLEDVCMRGPDDELTRTDRAQPALYAVAYALWEAFAAEAPGPPQAGAGHSLGEYTALAAAGIVEFETGLRLVAARGTAMQRAAAAASSGMAALLGADQDTAEQICAARRTDGGRLWVANLNAPGQVVVAGADEDIKWVTDNARDLGVRRAIPLNVAGAFHSPLMEPAAAELMMALEAATFHAGSFDVWANVSAAPLVDPVAVLAGQLVGPVRFADSVEAMAAAGADKFVHIGPGDVTAGMVRRTVREAEVLVVSELADVEQAAAALAVQ